MNKQTEALKMAIKALECIDEDLVQPTYYLLVKDAIPACKKALEQPAQEPECSNHPDAPHGFCRDASHSAGRYVCECEGWEAEQPEQEPVAIVYSMQDGYIGQMVVKNIPHKTPLYTHPAPSWQGLSDDEIRAIDDVTLGDYYVEELATKFARAIEQALKEKNHG